MKHESDSMGLVRRVLSRRGYLTYSGGVDDEQKVEPVPRLGWARELAEPIAGKRIADVGCWTGGLLSLFAGRGAKELVGLDVTGPWLLAAREAVPSAQFLEVADLRNLPSHLSGRFDVVLLLETLEHLPRGSEQEALRSLAALLSPGGVLILSTPAAGIAAPLDPAWFLVGHRHYRRETVTALASSAGLNVVRVRYSGNVWTSLDTVGMYLAKHLFHRPYSTPPFVASREPNGLYDNRRVGSANIWLETRAGQ